MDEGHIIINPGDLAEEYVPDKIPGRDKQLLELANCLKPALFRRKPAHSWLYGPSGTGKTATSKYVLRQMESEAKIKGVYVNCWEYHTLHLVMEKIVTELRILHTAQSSTTYKLLKFQKHIQFNPFLIVLDEIDKPEPKERNNILYTLSTTANVGLICISNDRLALFSLDDRVRSRLNPRHIEFLPYTENELIAILTQRAGLSLLPKSWNDKVLQRIASISGGDARMAIHTLKDSAHDAEINRDKAITESHIRNGLKNSSGWKKTYLLEQLTPDHKILFMIIEKNPSITSGELWQNYILECRERGTEAIAVRTFSKYTARLRDVGLIRMEPAKVKEGNIRKFYSLE
jgi:cell division control protein 6